MEETQLSSISISYRHIEVEQSIKMINNKDMYNK